MENPAKTNILRSWKEISAYLGYGERTCIRWEQKYGLPVHRAEAGASKSPVVAYKDELDAWFKETFKKPGVPPPPQGASRRPPAWLLLVAGPILAAAAFFVFRSGLVSKGQPADFAIRGSSLVVLDERGRELWSHDFKVEGLEVEAFYRMLFQVADTARTPVCLPSLVIRDINNDGRNEVLFALHRRGDNFGEGVLYCFDSRGGVLWKRPTGREMSFGGRTFPADYRIRGFQVHDINGDGRLEIAVISFNYPQWPCQLALLDADGRPLGEYWNSGYLTDIGYADLDGDGREEMLVGGVNNQYGGCLIVFDPARVSGSSPQTGEFKSDTLPPGSEKFYILSPRSDVSLALGEMVEGVWKIGLTSNKRIAAYTDSVLEYDFDFGLRCLTVDWGHAYMVKHNELRAAGKVNTDFGEAYRQMLARGVRYWDGSKWVPEPTSNLRNVRPLE